MVDGALVSITEEQLFSRNQLLGFFLHLFCPHGLAGRAGPRAEAQQPETKPHRRNSNPSRPNRRQASKTPTRRPTSARHHEGESHQSDEKPPGDTRGGGPRERHPAGGDQREHDSRTKQTHDKQSGQRDTRTRGNTAQPSETKDDTQPTGPARGTAPRQRPRNRPGTGRAFGAPRRRALPGRRQNGARAL